MSRRSRPIVQVDVFTTEAYTGAPAAVCITTAMPDDNWMARVSREMACPNTAFAQPRADDDGFDLRWFTGGGSRSLCAGMRLSRRLMSSTRTGTLARAIMRFHTQSGVLSRGYPAGRLGRDEFSD